MNQPSPAPQPEPTWRQKNAAKARTVLAEKRANGEAPMCYRWAAPKDKEYQVEAQLVNEILLHFGAVSWLWIWRENTGRAYGAGIVQKAIKALVSGAWKAALDILRASRPIIFGIPGRADIQGIICRGEGVAGRPFAIECKHHGRKRTAEQELWAKNFVRFGGVYVLAEQISDVYRALDAAGYDDLLEAMGVDRGTLAPAAAEEPQP